MVFSRFVNRVNEFIQSQSIGGVVLGISALLAIIIANSGLGAGYQAFLNVPGQVIIGDDWLKLQKPLLLWVNDLWMAVFFFLVGLEIKRELLEGELSSRKQAMLPAVAALGGMAVPAIIYSAFNGADPVALRGWAIPAATDIAFALGILALLASRVPPSLKVFLTAVAIIDDLGAILIIAFFYTEQLSLPMLGLAAVGAVALLILNRLKVGSVTAYVLVGVIVWVGLLKSGVHATLAGVITALAIPLTVKSKTGESDSPLKRIEHDLHPWVAFLILPMFAFANAGVSLQGVELATLAQGVPMGIMAGLVLGKAIGVFGASWLMIRFGGADLPVQASWRQFFAVCVLCGVGFTMSLFIGSLAFSGQGPQFDVYVKLGVLVGSLISALLATAILLSTPRRA